MYLNLRLGMSTSPKCSMRRRFLAISGTYTFGHTQVFTVTPYMRFHCSINMKHRWKETAGNPHSAQILDGLRLWALLKAHLIFESLCFGISDCEPCFGISDFRESENQDFRISEMPDFLVGLSESRKSGVRISGLQIQIIHASGRYFQIHVLYMFQFFELCL